MRATPPPLDGCPLSRHVPFPRPRARPLLGLLALGLLAGLASPARGQCYISPSGNNITAQGADYTITLSIGVQYRNPVIHVREEPNGAWQDHPGTSYTIVTDPLLAREWTYYATVEYYSMGQWRTWQSTNCAVIAISTWLESIEFLCDYPLYQRGWTDGVRQGRDMPRPQVQRGQASYPACYLRGSQLSMQYCTTGTGQPTQVQVRFVANLQLDRTYGASSLEVWTMTVGPVLFTPGTPFTLVTQPLPDVVLRNILRHSFRAEVVFRRDGEIRTIDATDAWTTIVYGVLADPNLTFPKYYDGDMDVPPLKSVPWVEAVNRVVGHVSQDGLDPTVGYDIAAMWKLLTDLYVYPQRPNGPAEWHYDPTTPIYYVPDQAKDLIRFDLYSMLTFDEADCQDFSAYYECLARALGIAGVNRLQLDDFDHSTRFRLNRLLYCGSATWTPDDPPNWFNYHRVVAWPSSAPQGGGIYDWCAGFDSFPGWFLSIGESRDSYLWLLVKWDALNGRYYSVPTWPPVPWSNLFSFYSTPADPDNNDPEYRTYQQVLSSAFPVP